MLARFDSAISFWLAVVLLLQPAAISNYEGEIFAVWNVGQGLWSTLVEPEACIHFDMGGEFAPWRKIEKLCSGRKNILLLSHGDWDHINQIPRAARILGDLCLARKPREKQSLRKQGVLKSIPACSFSGSEAKELPYRPKPYATANSSSRIFQILGELIAPGDSTDRDEAIWAHLIPSAATVRFLVAGHHGSRYSTSAELLGALPNLRMVVASARRKKYGHPHELVRMRLISRGISLLATEIWGNILLKL